MRRIRLVDADRERFGCPEWLERVDEVPTIREAMALEAAGGSLADWPKPGVPMTLGNYLVWAWMALRRNGVMPPPLDEFDISLGFDYEDPESPGKAPSAPSTKSTRTRSSATRAGNSTRRNRSS